MKKYSLLPAHSELNLVWARTHTKKMRDIKQAMIEIELPQNCRKIGHLKRIIKTAHARSRGGERQETEVE